MNRNIKGKTDVLFAQAKWRRNAYLYFLNDKVVFDCSDDEYGPIEFDFDILEDAIKVHKQKLKDEDKTTA
jgi:hypothetical protein